MFLKRTLVAAAFVVGTAVSASAADIPMAPMAPPPPPPMAPAFDWSGPYVGAFTGYTLGPAWIVGAQVGYNWQFDRFVVGLEGRVGVAPLVPALFTTVSARAGFLVAPKFLIYGAAGVGYTPFVPAFICISAAAWNTPSPTACRCSSRPVVSGSSAPAAARSRFRAA